MYSEVDIKLFAIIININFPIISHDHTNLLISAATFTMLIIHYYAIAFNTQLFLLTQKTNRSIHTPHVIGDNLSLTYISHTKLIVSYDVHMHCWDLLPISKLYILERQCNIAQKCYLFIRSTAALYAQAGVLKTIGASLPSKLVTIIFLFSLSGINSLSTSGSTASQYPQFSAENRIQQTMVYHITHHRFFDRDFYVK